MSGNSAETQSPPSEQLELPFQPEVPTLRYTKFDEMFLQAVFKRQRWVGKHVLKNASTVVAGNAVDKHLTKTTVSLMPEKWQSQFNAIYTAMESIICCYSLPFDCGNRRIIPVNCYDKLMTKFIAERGRLLDTLEEFTDVYEEEVVNAVRNIWLPKFNNDVNAYYESIGRLLPRIEDLSYRFDANVELYESTTACDTSRYSVTSLELKNYLEMSRNNAAAAIEESIRDVIDEPRKKFAQALSHLAQSLKTPGAMIRPGSFTAVLEAIQLCRAFADVTNKELLSSLGGLEALLNKTIVAGTDAMANGRRFTDAINESRDTLDEAFNRVIAVAHDNVSNEAILRKFGVNPRRIDFD